MSSLHLSYCQWIVKSVSRIFCLPWPPFGTYVQDWMQVFLENNSHYMNRFLNMITLLHIWQNCAFKWIFISENNLLCSFSRAQNPGHICYFIGGCNFHSYFLSSLVLHQMEYSNIFLSPRKYFLFKLIF